MRHLIVCTCLLLGFFAADSRAQNLSAAQLASPSRPQKKADEKKDPIKEAVGGGAALPPGQAITTEIYADEASSTPRIISVSLPGT